MKSHIYPRFLAKEWIKSFWVNDSDCFANFYIIDLYNEKYSLKEITNEEKIDEILNNDNILFLHLEDELIKEYEEEWCKYYETPFFILHSSLLKINKKYYESYSCKLKEGKKYSSYIKEFNNRFFNLNTPKNRETIWKFFTLSAFRSTFIKPDSRLINRNGEVKLKNLSDHFVNGNIAFDKNDIKNSFAKFSRSSTIDSFYFFILPINLMYMVNPPIYNWKDVFFAVPLPPFGQLCFLKKGYVIKSFCRDEINEFAFLKLSETYSDNAQYYAPFESIFNYDKTKIGLESLTVRFSYFLLALWTDNYGISKGNIYFLGNENSINNFMDSLKDNNVFQRRKDYVNDSNNYINNTVFFGTIKKN